MIAQGDKKVQNGYGYSQGHKVIDLDVISWVCILYMIVLPLKCFKNNGQCFKRLLDM